MNGAVHRYIMIKKTIYQQLFGSKDVS